MPYRPEPTPPPELDAGGLTPFALQGLTPERGQLLEERDLQGGPANRFPAKLTIAESRISGSLKGADLADLRVRDCRLDDADLANARLRGARFERSTLRSCRITGTSFDEGLLQDVVLTDCRAGFASFADAGLSRVRFVDCVLDEADFRGARLKDVHFVRCNLQRALFTEARLTDVAIVRCELDQLRHFSDLKGAALPWPDMVEHLPAIADAAGLHIWDEDA